VSNLKKDTILETSKTVEVAEEIWEDFLSVTKDSTVKGCFLKKNKINTISISKDNKSINVNLDLCVEQKDVINNYLKSKITFLMTHKYLVDGGEMEIIHYYCYKSNILLLTFSKPNDLSSIHPKCNYNKVQIPKFLRKISIYETEYFKENVSFLNSNAIKKEIILKVNKNCT